MTKAAEWIAHIREKNGLNPKDPWVMVYAEEIEMIQQEAFKAGKRAAKERMVRGGSVVLNCNTQDYAMRGL